MGSDTGGMKTEAAATKCKTPIVPLTDFGGVLVPSPLLISDDAQPLWPTYDPAQVGTTNSSAPTFISTPSKSLLLGKYDEPAQFHGKEMPLMTRAEHDAVQILLQQWPKRVRKRDLDKLSRHKDARKFLRRLADREPDWKALISFPDRSRRGRAATGYSLNLD